MVNNNKKLMGNTGQLQSQKPLPIALQELCFYVILNKSEIDVKQRCEAPEIEQINVESFLMYKYQRLSKCLEETGMYNRS